MGRPTGSWDLAVAAGILAVAALVMALAPGGALLALTLGIVALGLACASILLPGRATRVGAVIGVAAVGVLILGSVRLDAVGESAPSAGPTLGATSTPGSPIATPASTASPPAAAEQMIDPDATVVTYEIATDGMSVTHLSYVDLVDGQPTMIEELGVPPPFRRVVVVPPGSSVDLTDLSVTGMGGASSRRTMCTVTVDGSTVARSSADGAYGLVTCAVPSL